MKYIKDEEFVRGDCPMTKEEVRILSIAKLEIEEDHNLLDIGAGTGSISIQMSRCSPFGDVVAVEKDEEALRVLEENKQKFEADNLSIVKGDAAQVKLDGMFDGIFIGGSRGNIDKIIEKYYQMLKQGGKMVLNFITIDNLYRAMNMLKSFDMETECIQVGISRMRGSSCMLISNNPIFILSGKKHRRF